MNLKWFFFFWSRIFIVFPSSSSCPDAGIYPAVHTAHAGCHLELSLWSAQESWLLKGLDLQPLQVRWPRPRVTRDSVSISDFLKINQFLCLFANSRFKSAVMNFISAVTVPKRNLIVANICILRETLLIKLLKSALKALDFSSIKVVTWSSLVFDFLRSLQIFLGGVSSCFRSFCVRYMLETKKQCRMPLCVHIFIYLYCFK